MGVFKNKWKDLSEEESKEAAEELFKSVRGRYLIGQALAYAIKYIMEEQPEEEREESNAADMALIGNYSLANISAVAFQMYAPLIMEPAAKSVSPKEKSE